MWLKGYSMSLMGKIIDPTSYNNFKIRERVNQISKVHFFKKTIGTNYALRKEKGYFDFVITLGPFALADNDTEFLCHQKKFLCCQK